MGEEGQISIQVDSFDIFPKQQLSLHIPHYLLRPVFYFGAIGLCRILNQGIFDNYCSYVPRARNCETMGRFFNVMAGYYSVRSYNIGCYYRYERN